MSGSSHRGAFVFGLILGATGGALGALLMTPKSGQEIRGQIKDQTGPVQDRFSSATSGVRERTSGVQDRLTSATSSVRERADGMIDASKDKVTQIKQRGQEVEDQVLKPAHPGVSEPIVQDTLVPPTNSEPTPLAKPIEPQEPTAPGNE